MVSMCDIVSDKEWQIINDNENSRRGTQNNQKVDISAGKYTKETNSLFDWTATDRPLHIPADNLNSAPSTWTSIINLSGDWG